MKQFINKVLNKKINKTEEKLRKCVIEHTKALKELEDINNNFSLKRLDEMSVAVKNLKDTTIKVNNVSNKLENLQMIKTLINLKEELIIL